MRKIFLVLSIICYFQTFSQDIAGYKFLQRIRGIKLEESKIQEILVDPKTNNLAISYRSKKVLYISIYKLYSWDKINDYRLDDRVELYNSVFSPDGTIFYANFDSFKLLFSRINLAAGTVDTVECKETPRGCAPSEPTQYKVEYYTSDRMYYFRRDEAHPNDLLVYIDIMHFKTIEEKMEADLGRDVVAKEVKDFLENEARLKQGPIPGVTAAKTTTTTTTTSNTTTKPAAKSIIITEADIVKLLETGSFDKGDISMKLDDKAKKTLQTATNNPAVGSTPKTIEGMTFQVGEVIKLNNILFEQGKSDLLASSYPELDKLVKIMNEHPTMEIQVNGHTNNIGTHNLEISEARSKAVVDYIISKGIGAPRLKYKGFGATQPIASNETPDGQAKNRRVEFIITRK